MIFWQSGAPLGQGCWELMMYFSFMQASMYVTRRDCVKEHQFLEEEKRGKRVWSRSLKSLAVTVPRKSEMQKGLYFYFCIFPSCMMRKVENASYLLPPLPVRLFSFEMFICICYKRADCLNFDALVPFPVLSFCRRNFQPMITCGLMSL